MNQKKMFAYFLMLSDHMWADESTPFTGDGLKTTYKSTYNPEIAVEEEAWDEIIRYLAEKKYNTVLIDVGDGIQFESHPEISAPNAWTREKIAQKLSEIRALGMEPIPKLNFSTAHDTWLKEYRRMVSTPKYYEVCADLIRETCEIFGHPRLFHLGLDEEIVNCQLNKESVYVRGEKLYWHDNYYLFDQCEKQGARPWVWTDYYCWMQPDLFKKYMPTSVLQSNWFYRYFQDNPPMEYPYRAIRTYGWLDELGYDQVPTCSTFVAQENDYQTLVHCRKNISDEHLQGFMTAGWWNTTSSDMFLLKNDALRLWEARREVYPETL